MQTLNINIMKNNKKIESILLLPRKIIGSVVCALVFSLIGFFAGFVWGIIFPWDKDMYD